MMGFQRFPTFISFVVDTVFKRVHDGLSLPFVIYENSYLKKRRKKREKKA